MKNLQKKIFKNLFIFVFIFLCASKMSAQINDTVVKPEREFKNTIRFNITNPLIFGGKSIIFGYERVLKNNRSFSINIGQTGFPSLNLVSSEELKANSIRSEKGLHLSADYRFYLGKLNRYDAPRGVYVGPYYGYNSFEKKHNWTLNSDTFQGNVVSNLTLFKNQIELFELNKIIKIILHNYFF